MVTFRCYWRPKSDHSIDEWEDGAAFSEARGVAAIADGASSSFDAARWARELTRSFIANPPRTVDPEAFEAWTTAVAASFEGAPTEAVEGDAEEAPAGLVPGVPTVDADRYVAGSAPSAGAHPDAHGVLGGGEGLRHGRPAVEPVLAVGAWGPARAVPRVAGPVGPVDPVEEAGEGGTAAGGPRGGAEVPDQEATPESAELADQGDATRAGEPEPASAPAPWYVEEAAVRGSFATFLGLQFTETVDSRRWRAMAVGDACFFQVRASTLVTAFPLEDSDAFGSAPDLLTSQPFGGSHGGHRLQVRTGSVETGDVFYLATDAVSEWLLARSRVDPDLWPALEVLDHEGFAALVDHARRSGEMADDDSTLLRAVVGPRGEAAS